jgi:hypothetical protein
MVNNRSKSDVFVDTGYQDNGRMPHGDGLGYARNEGNGENALYLFGRMLQLDLWHGERLETVRCNRSLSTVWEKVRQSGGHLPHI